MGEGSITITPFVGMYLNEASYELSLGTSFRQQGAETWESFQELILPPHGFVLIKSREKVTLAPTIAGLVFTRSSWAQKGIDIAQGSCFCEPGTDNELTLEISNQNSQPITLRTGDTVAKLVFVEVS